MMCGAFPRRGDGTAWCTLEARHSGLHYDGGEGITFRSHRPRVRVTSDGKVVSVSPERRRPASRISRRS